jgi:hypothetical protein
LRALFQPLALTSSLPRKRKPQTLSQPSRPRQVNHLLTLLASLFCLVFCSTNQTSLFNLSRRLYTGGLLTFTHQRHPLSLSSNGSVLRYCHTTTDLALETIKPTPFVSPLSARLQLSRTDRRPTAFVSRPSSVRHVQPRDGAERTLSVASTTLAVNIQYTQAAMSTLTKRQSPLDDTSSADYPDSYGYDPSTCYEEHTCSWWWSSVSKLSSHPISSLSLSPIHSSIHPSSHNTIPSPAHH